jgi:septal ring factor EnvC (AmiA/AmiB activator)
VLRVDDPMELSASLSPSVKSPPDILSTFQRHDTAPIIALNARDGFVIDTALKIDQLQANLRILTRELSQLSAKLAELQESAAQDDRSYVYLQSERRSRDAKLDEMVRSFRDLKARLDRMEVRSDGYFHAYTSFEAVSRKLAELEEASEEAKKSKRGDTLRACLIAGAMITAAAIVALSMMLSPASTLG